MVSGTTAAHYRHVLMVLIKYCRPHHRCAAVLGVPGGKDPYLIGHTLLKAHAAAVHVYRTQFQDEQEVLRGTTTTTLPLTH